MSWREKGQKEIKTLVRAAKLAVMYAGGHEYFGVGGRPKPLELGKENIRIWRGRTGRTTER